MSNKKYICIAKYICTDRNVWYTLIDANRNTLNIPGDNLKRQIIFNNITVENLKLTRDNRLILNRNYDILKFSKKEA